MSQRILVCVIAAATASSCGFIERNTIGIFGAQSEPEQAASSADQAPLAAPIENIKTSVNIEKLEPQKITDAGSVELVWSASDHGVDSFLINYGSSRDKLNQQLKLTNSDIEIYQDPSEGKVYRYVMKDIPKDKRMFVSVTAVRGETHSQPSEVMEVSAEKEQGKRS